MKKQKKIICLCLILAMFVTILPCEVNAQGKKTWGEAYEEVLKKYGSDATAKLIYLDNDNIPEVFVHTEDRDDILISYYKGKVYENYLYRWIDLSFTYIPKKGKICFKTGGGRREYTIVAKLKRGRLNYSFVGYLDSDLSKQKISFAYAKKNQLAKGGKAKCKEISEKQYFEKIQKATANLGGKKAKDVCTSDYYGGHSQLLYLDKVRHQIKNLSGTNMDVNNDGKYENVRFIKKNESDHLSILINGKKVLTKKGFYADASLKTYTFDNNTYLCLKMMDYDDITSYFSFYKYKNGKLQKIYDLQKTFLPSGYGEKDAIELKVKQDANRLLIESGWNPSALGYVRTKYNVIYNQGKFKRESPIYDIVSYGTDNSTAHPYLGLKRNITLYNSYNMKTKISDIKKGEKICFTKVYAKGKNVFLKATTASGITGWFKVELNKKYFSDRDIVIAG